MGEFWKGPTDYVCQSTSGVSEVVGKLVQPSLMSSESVFSRGDR